MNLYRVELGDSEGSDGIEHLDVLAHDFDEAYSKVRKEMECRWRKLMHEDAKEPLKDRLPKGYHFVIDSITKKTTIDVE